MALSLLLFLVQAFTGAMTISYYTSIIFARFLPAAGSRGNSTDDDAGGGVGDWLEYGGVLVIGLNYVIGYLVASAFLMPNFRRRTLLVGSALSMAAATATVAFMSQYGAGTGRLFSHETVLHFSPRLSDLVGAVTASTVSALSLSGFVLSYSAGFGPIPYIYLGELFPPEHNGLSTGLVSLGMCTFNFVSLKTFPYMLEVRL